MLRKAALLGGALSSLVYVLGIDVVAALQYPDYHGYADQMVSELFAAAAPTRPLLIPIMLAYNVLVAAFAIGVWASAPRDRATRVTAAAIIAYAVTSTAGLLLFYMDVRGSMDSQRDAAHIAATIVMSMCIVAMMAAAAFTRGRRFRAYSFATLAVVIVFGVWAGVLARPMPQSTPRLGLAERVNIYATMLWIAVLAIAFLRTPRVSISARSQTGTACLSPDTRARQAGC